MKGILFKEPLFNAIIEGRKTQTRRIIEPQPNARGLRTSNVLFEDWHGNKAKPRYNKGEVVYLKEPYIDDLRMNKVFYRFNKTDRKEIEREFSEIKNPWKNKLFMPSEVARYFIKIKNVRTERVAEISEEDAIAEGIVETGFGFTTLPMPEKNIPMHATAKDAFEKLWDSINLRYKRDKHGTLTAYPFKGKTITRTEGNGRIIQVISNPWVWVYEFELIK